MIVRETRCLGEIKKILCDPEIYRVISDDNRPSIEEFEPPLERGITYLGGYVDNEIIALMIYHTENERLYCHIQVLPEFREQYAKEFATKALNEQLEDSQECWCEIPICYVNVLRFAIGFGFEYVERQYKSYLNNGELIDIMVMRYTHGIRKKPNRFNSSKSG